MTSYGKVKVNTITFDNSGTATDVPVSTIAVDSDLALKADLSSPTFTGTINGGNLVLSGDLTVNGTTTSIDSTNLEVEDRNIQIGKVSTPSNTTADGGGITLLGGSDGDKTINWINSTNAWTFSEHIHLVDNKKLFVGGVSGTTDGLEIVHNGSNSIINDSGTGALQLQTGGATKLEIQSGGINVTGAITVNGAALGGGLSVADQFGHSQEGLTQNTDKYFDGLNYTKTHSASSSVMTVAGGSSEGVFTFPSTGMYRIDYSAFVSINSGGYYRLHCVGSRDNASSWTENVIYTETLEDANNANSYKNYSNHYGFFNVTNTTNDKVKFGVKFPSNNGGVEGIRIIFMKLN